MKDLSSLPIWYAENETPAANLYKVREHHIHGLFAFRGFIFGGKEGTGSLFKWSFESCGYRLTGPRVKGMGLADILSTAEGEIVDSQD